MKVVWVMKHFARGGAERLLLELAPHMSEVEFVPVAVRGEPQELVPAFEAIGLPCITLGGGSDLDPRWVLRLRKLVGRVAPDLVHLHLPYVGAGGRMAGLAKHVPIVYTEHGPWTSYRLPTRVANALTYGFNAKVIAVSEAVRSSILSSSWGARFRDRIVVIPNGIDAERVLADAETPVDLDLPTSSFGTVGHLTHHKGIDVLIDAAHLLARDGHASPCVIVGDGLLRDELRRRAAPSAADIRFLGSRGDARSIVRKLGIFVLPSRVEGSPLSLLEAMALGVPVVAADVGGVSELVDHGRNGLLVAPSNPRELADAVARLLTDRPFATRLGDAGRATVTDAWHIRDRARDYVGIYEGVLAI